MTDTDPSYGETGYADIERRSEHVTEDEVEWTLHLQAVSFSHREVLPKSANSSDATEDARAALADAIRDGDAHIRWSTQTRTKSDLEAHEAMSDSLACERCRKPIHGHMNELSTDSPYYDVDFGHHHPDYIYVCDPCRDTIKIDQDEEEP